MSSHDPHDHCDGSDESVTPTARRRPRPFVVVTSHELNDAALGLRIFDCFSRQRRTLTTAEISEIVHAPAQDVTRHAERLARTGYLQADSSSGERAWTLIADER
ncbi:MAG: helix-turn-helix domain-containing protein [Solirubrobacteraceae bacterium]